MNDNIQNFIKEFHKNRNMFKWNEQDYIDVILKLEKMINEKRGVRMNLETINKWLDEECGCSYTRLEELHDFYFEKYCDLQQENKQLKEKINKAIRMLEIQIEVIKEQPSDNALNDNMEIKQREMVIRLLKEVSE